MAATGQLAHAIVSMADSRREIIQQEIETDFIDFFIEVHEFTGLTKAPYEPLGIGSFCKCTLETRGRPVIVRGKDEYEVRTASSYPLEFLSTAGMFNWMQAHGFEYCPRGCHGAADAGGMNKDDLRWRRLFFRLKVPRAFVLSHPGVVM